MLGKFFEFGRGQAEGTLILTETEPRNDFIDLSQGRTEGKSPFRGRGIGRPLNLLVKHLRILG